MSTLIIELADDKRSTEVNEVLEAKLLERLVVEVLVVEVLVVKLLMAPVLDLLETEEDGMLD